MSGKDDSILKTVENEPAYEEKNTNCYRGTTGIRILLLFGNRDAGFICKKKRGTRDAGPA
jgi:hypothetical protein